MGYCTADNYVRIDVWKPSGKWYEKLALGWDRYSSTPYKNVELIHETFLRCLYLQYPRFRTGYEGWRVTCLEPCHEHSHPLMIEL